MTIFKRLFGKASADEARQIPDNQAVLVNLDGTGLPDHVYRDCDLATIEDRLTQVIEQQRLGDFDGNEVGTTGVTLYMYGADADRLFAGIEPTLRGYPLCKGVRVVIWYGGPGAKKREVKF